MQRLLVGIILFCCTITSAWSAEKVVLQLKWEHEFQFAGYYAALWQGYYQDAGIDVDIRPISRPDGSMVSPIEEIQNGNAHFAVSALDILTAKDKGVDVVVLASMFQRGQTAVFSLADTPIADLSQLAKLRIAINPNDNASKAEIEAVFMSQGFDVKQINFIHAPNTIDALINNEADAIVTYEISATFSANEKGVKLNKLDPVDYGISFYGDTLFSSAQLTQRDPKLVANFISASIKGWKYAIAHKEEIAKRIANELPRHLFSYDNSYQYNLAFADLIDSLIGYPEQQIGEVNQDRWSTMNDKLRELGLIHSHLVKEEFFFTAQDNDTSLTINIWFLLTFIILLVLIYISWYKRNIALSLLCIILFAFAADMQIVQVLNTEHKQRTKLNLFRQLTSIGAKLEGDLQTNLSMLSGFSAYISASPELSYKQFSQYAREIFRKEPMLHNFAAAKNLVVNYVYPLAGNEKAIGLNYRQNAAQKEMVMQVVNTGQLLVAGPVELVQGGLAFIGRAPIYTGSGIERTLWGIISAPIDADALYLQTGILASAKNLNLAIRSTDTQGQKGPVFFGEPSTFDDPEAIQTVIKVGAGTWHLAATPSQFSNNESNITILRFILIVTTLIICIFAVVRIRQQKERLDLQTTILINQQLLESVGQVAKIGGWKLDHNLNFLQWSKQSSLLLGKQVNYHPNSLDEISTLFEAQAFSLLNNHIEKALFSHEPFELDIELVKENETKVWLRIIVSVSMLNGEPLITGTMQDVTDKVLSAKIIERQATYDALTALPNRVLFNDRLINAMETAARKENKVAVLFVDLDRFKDVNDNHGHQTGDKLLIAAAERISHCVRDYDTVSRLSGDEFGVILADINQFSDALRVSEQILKTMQHSYDIDDNILHCHASIGIALYPDDGNDAQSLIQKADQAMYEVKANGRNGCQFYTKEMQERSEYRHNLLNDLIDAVDENAITPYFQPVINLETNKVSKCESLARWQKADDSFVSPFEFINLAEESGLINRIDLSMLEKSAQALILMKLQGINVGLTINVSPRVFHTKDKALETWLACIRELSQQLDITVEITERLLTHDSEKALDVLNKLRDYGVKIAIDDFGTGYSSLSYLIKFQVDIIKIDRSFIDGIGKESSAETLIEIIVLMAKKLGIQVVAEGIETQTQLDFLRKNHCDYGQGYFLGRPMSASQLKPFVDDTNE